MIHQLHPGLVGKELNDGGGTANTLDRPGQGLPRPLRRLLPVLASDPLFDLVAGALAVGFRLAVGVRSLGLQTLAARGIGSLETQRGVLAQRRSHHPGPGRPSTSPLSLRGRS
jgi:hypothetical protein